MKIRTINRTKQELKNIIDLFKSDSEESYKLGLTLVAKYANKYTKMCIPVHVSTLTSLQHGESISMNCLYNYYQYQGYLNAELMSLYYIVYYKTFIYDSYIRHCDYAMNNIYGPVDATELHRAMIIFYLQCIIDNKDVFININLNDL